MIQVVQQVSPEPWLHAYSRRHNRRVNRRRPGAPSGGFSPADLPGLHTWIEGDIGASFNTSPDPDQYESLTNQGPAGGIFDGGSSPTQPQVDEATFGRVAPLFTSGRRFESSLAASAYTFTNNAAGNATWYIRFLAASTGSTRVVLGTASALAVHIGIQIAYLNNNNLRYQASNGTDQTTFTIGNVASETAITVVVTKSGTALASRVNGASGGSATLTTATDTDSEHSILTGANEAGNLPLNGAIGAIILATAVHDTDTIQQVEAYLAQRWPS